MTNKASRSFVLIMALALVSGLAFFAKPARADNGCVTHWYVYNHSPWTVSVTIWNETKQIPPGGTAWFQYPALSSVGCKVIRVFDGFQIFVCGGLLNSGPFNLELVPGDHIAVVEGNGFRDLGKTAGSKSAEDGLIAAIKIFAQIFGG